MAPSVRALLLVEDSSSFSLYIQTCVDKDPAGIQRRGQSLFCLSAQAFNLLSVLLVGRPSFRLAAFKACTADRLVVFKSIVALDAFLPELLF
jgi:hypothetical protein